MALYFIEVGKHRFVCGLFWQTLSDPSGRADEIAEVGRKLKFDQMVLFKEYGVAQVGLAQSSEAGARGLLSFGAAVAKAVSVKGVHYGGMKQQAANWLGAFSLPNGRWLYMAIRGLAILPNGDFVGSKDEVLKRLQDDYVHGGWDVVIGDPELASAGFPSFSAWTVDDLLPRRQNGDLRIHKWWALQPIEQGKLRWRRAAAAVAAVAIAAAGTYWWNHERAMVARQKALAAAQTVHPAQVAKALPEAPHGWAAKPLPQAFARLCLDAMKNDPGGWSLDQFACGPDLASHIWTRGDADVRDLMASLPQAAVEWSSGNRASYSEPIKPAAGGDEALLKSAEVLAGLSGVFQAIGVPLHIEAAAPAPAGGQQMVLPPKWETFGFSAQLGPLPPTEIAALLALPGVRLEKLLYRNGEWTLEGLIYGK